MRCTCWRKYPASAKSNAVRLCLCYAVVGSSDMVCFIVPVASGKHDDDQQLARDVICGVGTIAAARIVSCLEPRTQDTGAASAKTCHQSMGRPNLLLGPSPAPQHPAVVARLANISKPKNCAARAVPKPQRPRQRGHHHFPQPLPIGALSEPGREYLQENTSPQAELDLKFGQGQSLGYSNKPLLSP
eukprot:6458043-Amphidinium_carterae.1